MTKDQDKDKDDDKSKGIGAKCLPCRKQIFHRDNLIKKVAINFHYRYG